MEGGGEGRTKKPQAKRLKPMGPERTVGTVSRWKGSDMGGEGRTAKPQANRL